MIRNTHLFPRWTFILGILLCGELLMALLACSHAADTQKPSLPPLTVGIQKHPRPAVFNWPAPEKLPPFNPASDQQWQVDLRSRDLSKLDLAGRARDLSFADFDSKTHWPATLPEGFAPARLMDLGRNPGLGLRRVHEKGITGKGIGLAIIDQTLLVDHAEYKDRLRHYEEIHVVGGNGASMHGAAVSSIAVGRTVGVAPEADLYYIAEIHGEMAGRGFVFDFTWLAQSIDRILELNATLPPGKKIRVISISVGWNPQQKGYQAVTAAVKRAKEQGVFIVSSSLEETFGLKFNGMGRDPLGDPDAAGSYAPGMFWQKYFVKTSGSIVKNALLVPMDSRCTASPTGEHDYVFYREGGWSWSIPYVAGLYALACQVRPDVTPELFWKTALETGATIPLNIEGKAYPFGAIAQPERLLEKLAPIKK